MSSSSDYTSVPLTLLDATKGNTDIIIQFSIYFKEQLSFEKLQQSWEELVVAWPIVSARIRKSSHSPSGLEYQVPSPAGLEKIREREQSRDPKERQFYCLDEGSRSVASYSPALAHVDPSQNSIFSAVAPSEKEHKRIVAANSLYSTEEYLRSDSPLVSVQVTRFSDGTIVSLCMSHVIGDGFSVREMLQSWQNILHGKGPPEPLQDLGMDPFISLGPDTASKNAKKPPPPQGFYLFNFREKVHFLTNFLYDVHIARPESKLQQRYIFLPRHEVEEMQRQVKGDIERKAAREGRAVTKADQVGKSDILYAWLMKHSHAGLPTSWYSTPLSILNVRRRKPTGIETLPRHFFYGAAYAVPLDSLKVDDLMKMPLSELALHVRNSLAKRSDPDAAREGIEFYLNYTAWNQKSNGEFPFFCRPSHRWSGLSDWRPLRLFDLDFGPAALDKTKKSAAASGLNVQMGCEMSKRDRWVCMGDSKYGSWMTGYMSIDQWNHPQGFGKYTQHLHSNNVRESRL